MRNEIRENEMKTLANELYIIDDMKDIPYLLGNNTSSLQAYIIEKLKRKPEDINLLIYLGLYQNQDMNDDGDYFPTVQITFREKIPNTEIYREIRTIYYNELTGEIFDENPTFILDIQKIKYLSQKYNKPYQEIISELFRDYCFADGREMNLREIYEMTDIRLNEETKGE